MALQEQLPVSSNRMCGYERVRVDLAQTSFFEGREFRTFKEFNIAATQTYLIRLIAPIDVIVSNISIAIDAGHVKFSIEAGGTPGGTFSETLPVINVNGMTGVGDRRKNSAGAYYTPQVTASAGGTLAGSTVYDVIRLKTATNSNFASSIGNSPQDEQAAPPLHLFYRIENLSATDAATGVINFRWEERPIGFFD